MMANRVIFTNNNVTVLRDLLFLVGVRVSLEDIGAWTADQLNQAGHWAAFAHISPVYGGTVPPKPEFLQVKEMSNEQASH